MRLNIRSRWLEKYAPLRKKIITTNGRTPGHLDCNAHPIMIGPRDKPNAPAFIWNPKQSKAVRKTTGHIARGMAILYTPLNVPVNTPASFLKPSSCYVMLCFVVLYYVMLCFVMLCCVVFCCVILCYAMLCYVMLCFVMKVIQPFNM